LNTLGDLSREDAGIVMDTLEELKKEGSLRSYGWSTEKNWILMRSS
jgi:aryl-alcohol dehydrogenase-like predicted oxidoreductase